VEFVEEPQANGKTIRWCSVDVGAANGTGEPQGIVCGAHNFEVGDLVVVVLPGAVLPGNFAIAARKTYGHVSNGMICAEDEIGLGHDHEGIIVLSRLLGEEKAATLQPGDDAIALLGLGEETVETNVTPDRGYCFSVRGLAREYWHAQGSPEGGFRDPADIVTPQPNTGGTPTAASDTAPPFNTIAEASIEKDMSPLDLDILTTGFSGLPKGVLDTRVPGAGTLAGPFPMQGPALTDDSYTGDTTHRFYQDWQQADCSVSNVTKDNNSGCLSDLFPFVVSTNTSQGNSMGFLNAELGQAPILKMLADRFTLGDNFHQSFHGGTGANHFMLGTGDAGFWSDGNGNPTVPPSIANPNPAPGTVNKFTVDGNFSNCADVNQPGVKPIVSYLNNLPYAAEPNCKPNHFYMLNNTNPGFLPNGALAHGSTLPPSSVRTIGDALIEKQISWAYYGGAYNDAVALSDAAVAANPNSPNIGAAAVANIAHTVIAHHGFQPRDAGHDSFGTAAEAGEEVGLDEAGGDAQVGLHPLRVEPDGDAVAVLAHPGERRAVARVVVDDADAVVDLVAEHAAQLLLGVAAVRPRRHEDRDVVEVDDAVELLEHGGDHEVARLGPGAVAHRDGDRLARLGDLAQRRAGDRLAHRGVQRRHRVGGGLRVHGLHDRGALLRELDAEPLLAVRQPDLH